MAPKIPPFGEWEEGKGGENITVRFDNARKKKTNGQMINPNDSKDNPNMLSKKAGPSAQPKGKRGGIPRFGGWENGENVGAGYTEVFDNVKIVKKGQPTASANEPQMNREMQPAALPQARTQPKPAKLEPKQEKRPKVPTFGSWDAGEGDFGYTERFETVRNNTKNNGCTVTPESSNVPPNEEGRPKMSLFGAWEEGDNGRGAYPAYFKNNAEAVLQPVEPQVKRDASNTARPAAGGTKNKGDDHHLRNASKQSDASVGSPSESATKYRKQNPINQKGGRLNQKPPAGRASQIPERGAVVPAWGGWRNDASQAKDITGAFKRAKEGKNTPIHIHSNVPPGNHQPPKPPKPKHIIRRSRLAWWQQMQYYNLKVEEGYERTLL